MHKTLIIILIAVAGAGVTQAADFAQTQALTDSVPNKNLIKSMLHWVSAFTLYSDVELSDKIDLKEYLEVGDIVGSILTNLELSASIAEFKAATYVNVYPKGLVNNSHWLLKKLNDISHAQYNVLNAPYIMLEVWFTPIDNNTGYLVNVNLKGSDEIKDLASTSDRINSKLTGKKFATPKEAKATVNQAIFDGLAQLRQALGNTFAPNLAVRVDEEVYLNNQTIETWQRSEGSIVLEAVDRNHTPLTGNLTWTNATGTGSSALYIPDKAGINTVTVRHGNNQISVKVRVKEFSVKWQDLLKQILQEAISQLLDEGEKAISQSIEKRRQAHQVAWQQQQEVQVLLQLQSSRLTKFEITEVTVGSQSNGQQNVLVTSVPDDERYQKAIASFINFRALFIEEQLKEVRKVMLLTLLTGANFDKLVGVVEKDIAVVAAELIVKLARGEGKDEIKAYAMRYLNEKLDAVIAQQLSGEMLELHTMLNSGATKAEIKRWLSAKTAEKIMTLIN